ncbi:MAG: hypothetical protein ABS35_44780 [Kaistia sp. SCN 65-12]|nr:MAG: hypothetical protein ABS35_44780 [Kaistia sp. SCN 65-12]
MTTRRTFLLAGLLVAAASAVPASRAAFAGGASPRPAYILGATAITQVFGAGQRLVAIALKHDRQVDPAALDPTLYSVEDRTVTRVYTSASPVQAADGTEGVYVIVELSPDDAAGQLLVSDGPAPTRLPAAATLTIQPAGTAPGKPSDDQPEGGPPDFGTMPRSVATRAAINLVVDDFIQAEFHDPVTGDTLAYNLFVPAGHPSSAPLPVVLFMHDAGNTSTVVDTTLVQGLGAVSWASPEDQARHKAIVLAPQYASQVVNDESQATSLLDTTLHLLERIVTEQKADRDRLYLTGQSGGGMMSIAMLVKEPQKFAAAFLVACQWDPSVVAPLARQKLWVVVSEGDAKAFPGQNAIMEVIENEGTAISRARWNGTASPEQFQAAVTEQEAVGSPVHYTTLMAGTVVPAGQPDTPGANHVNTWRIAYDIPGIRDWVLRQSRGS